MTTRTIQQLFDLTGKTALITGGSRGPGLRMAHALGEAGKHITGQYLPVDGGVNIVTGA